MLRRILVVAVVFAISATASAETVATCGSSKGHGYYIPKVPVPVAESGWSDEAISKGNFQLIRSGENWDVIFTDASGGTLSARADGAKIAGKITPDGDILVHVFYKKVHETYVFWLSLKDPIVTYSSAKFAALIQKHSLMSAKCRRGS